MKTTAGWLGIGVLVLVCLNSALLVVTLRSSSAASVARRLAVVNCDTTVISRIDANNNRELNLEGWVAALKARLATATSAPPPVRAANLTAARLYASIVRRYTYYARPDCLNEAATQTKWHDPPPKPSLPKVPTR